MCPVGSADDYGAELLTLDTGLKLKIYIYIGRNETSRNQLQVFVCWYFVGAPSLQCVAIFALHFAFFHCFRFIDLAERNKN